MPSQKGQRDPGFINGGSIPRPVKLFDQYAEQSVLSAILLDPSLAISLLTELSPDDFFINKNRSLFEVFRELQDEGVAIDTISVMDRIDRSGLDKVGCDQQFLGDLCQDIPLESVVSSHARIVKDYSVIRELHSAAQSILTDIAQSPDNAEALLGKAEQKIFSIGEQSVSAKGFVPISEFVKTGHDNIKAMIGRGTALTGLSTGFDELDHFTTGLHSGQLIIIAARPSIGKCLGKGTQILMFDGRLKPVEDIKPGELLMGDDSTPRTVLSTVIGHGKMYWIRQNKGIDYRVNEDHILSLKRSKTEWKHKHGDILNIPVKEYINKSNRFKASYKGYRVAVEFPDTAVDIEPYFLGLWLGDGDKDSVRITTIDNEVVRYLEEYSSRLGLSVHVTQTKDHCNSYGITSFQHDSAAMKSKSLQSKLRRLNLLNNKHIPYDYIYNSREKRLQLLAGLIDSDGFYNNMGSIEITQKNYNLAYQIKFLANTLGFRASINPKKASIKRTGFSCTVYRVLVSGDLHLIPTRIPRKQAPASKCIRETKHTGIKVEYDGIDDYYGFEIDGNGLFLLEDMTVTHNTALALNMSELIANKGNGVGFFSLEMSGDQLAQRMISTRSNISPRALINGLAPERHIKEIERAAVEISKMPIYIDDRAGLTAREIRGAARRLKKQHDIKVIFIDYLQLMTGDGETREREIAYISSELKAMAKELGIPVIALSQLNRKVIDRSGAPRLSDLRESGAIEQDADMVLFLHDAHSQSGEIDGTDNSQRELQLIIGKQRNGPRVIMPIQFDPNTTKFSQCGKPVEGD